jgi:ABC-2 type transport system ATP-binding protein
VDIRKDLFYRLSEADMPIMQLRKDEKSLEDVFLELTGDDSTAVGAVSEETEQEPKEIAGTSDDATTQEQAESQEVTENDSDI